MGALTTNALVLLCAVAGYTILSVSQVGQKVGLHLFTRSKLRGAALWVVATFGTFISFVLVLYAISIGPVAVVGALTGVGMAALTVISRFWLKEHIGPREVAAVIAIAVGAGVMGAEPLETGRAARVGLLWWSLAGWVVVYLTTWAFLRRTHFSGIVLGGLAGAIAAYSQLFQKLATVNLTLENGLWSLILDLATSVPLVVAVLLTVGSMVSAQVAYTSGEAIRIIPSYTAHASAVPVLGGIVVYDERLTVIQWVGMAALLAGTMLLVFRRPRHSRSARPAGA